MTSNKVAVMIDLMAMHANNDSNMDTNTKYPHFYGYGYVLLMPSIPNF